MNRMSALLVPVPTVDHGGGPAPNDGPNRPMPVGHLRPRWMPAPGHVPGHLDGRAAAVGTQQGHGPITAGRRTVLTKSPEMGRTRGSDRDSSLSTRWRPAPVRDSEGLGRFVSALGPRIGNGCIVGGSSFRGNTRKSSWPQAVGALPWTRLGAVEADTRSTNSPSSAQDATTSRASTSDRLWSEQLQRVGGACGRLPAPRVRWTPHDVDHDVPARPRPLDPACAANTLVDTGSPAEPVASGRTSTSNSRSRKCASAGGTGENRTHRTCSLGRISSSFRATARAVDA